MQQLTYADTLVSLSFNQLFFLSSSLAPTCFLALLVSRHSNSSYRKDSPRGREGFRHFLETSRTWQRRRNYEFVTSARFEHRLRRMQ